MKRFLKRKKRFLIVWTALAAAWIAFVWYATRPPSRSDDVVVLSAPDVPRMVFAKNLEGRRVQVVLRFPLRWSDGRTVGRYSPSVGGSATPTMEFHFREPVAGDPRVVRGRVSGFRYDLLARLNRLPGMAIIVACEADPDRP